MLARTRWQKGRGSFRLWDGTLDGRRLGVVGYDDNTTGAFEWSGDEWAEVDDLDPAELAHRIAAANGEEDDRE